MNKIEKIKKKIEELENIPKYGSKNEIKRNLKKAEIEWMMKDHQIFEEGENDFDKFIDKFFKHHKLNAEGYYTKSSDLHTDIGQELIKSSGFITNEKCDGIFAVPRSYAKTKISTLFYPLYLMMYAKDLNDYIVIVSNNSTTSKLIIDNLIYEIKYYKNHMITYGIDVFEYTNSYIKFITPNGIVKIECVTPSNFPRGLKYGNKRPTTIIVDDIESRGHGNKVGVENKHYRDFIKETFETQILSSNKKSCNVVVFGTFLSENCYLKELFVDKLNDKSWISYFIPSIDKYGTSEAKSNWEERYDIEMMTKLHQKSIKDGLEKEFRYDYMLLKEDEFDTKKEKMSDKDILEEIARLLKESDRDKELWCD